MAGRPMQAIPVTPETEAFHAGMREGRFMIRRCTACNRAHWYPRALCPFCFGETVWEQASGDGVIYSYTVMRRVPVPYALAYVTLAEGPAMMTNIVDCDFDALRIGQGVRVVLTPSQEGSLVPCFTPIAGSPAR